MVTVVCAQSLRFLPPPKHNQDGESLFCGAHDIKRRKKKKRNLKQRHRTFICVHSGTLLVSLRIMSCTHIFLALMSRCQIENKEQQTVMGHTVTTTQWWLSVYCSHRDIVTHMSYVNDVHICPLTVRMLACSHFAVCDAY